MLGGDDEEASDGSAANEGEVDDDALVQSVFDGLELRRREWAALHPDAYDDFRVTIVGGACLHERTGLVADAFSAQASTADAKAFCRARDLTQSVRSTITAYGEAACGVLARAWARKMQFYSNLAVARANLECVFSDRALCREPTELTNLAADSIGHRLLLGRVAQTRGLFAAP